MYQSEKTYAQIQKEYGVSSSALSSWVRKYSQVKADDSTILTARQIKLLQKRNAELEERRRPSHREQENLEIRRRILETYARSDKRLGVRKMRLCLAREHCINISEGRVYRLMQQMKPPKMSTVKPPKAAVNKVIACRVGNKIDRFLALDTLRGAVRLRGVSKGVMFHTDRGVQFTSGDFRKAIDELGLVQSFSAKGHPYDNAVMECFFKCLKKEELDRRSFQTVGQRKQSLLSYISGFYNAKRPHSQFP